MRLFLVLAVLPACVSKRTAYVYPDDLYHFSYVRRSKAVAEFAARKDASQLPDAFRLLLDEDAGVRFLAYETIKDLSPGGEDFGYRPYLAEDVRIGIVSRWEAWWRKRREPGGIGG